MADLISVLVCALALGLCWFLLPLRAALNERKLVSLAAIPCAEPARWPLVSVLVPARNEEAIIAEAVQSLLELDYPELEIILINDRSSDRTGEIAESLARLDPRVRTLHLDKLPDGWLGKVHALHRGLEVSRGEWLLFTDADIHFEPGTLKRAIAYCLQRPLAFLSLLPRFRETGAVIGAAQTVFGTILLSLLDPDRIADPRNEMAMGVGAFNLLERSVIDAEEGLEWLRMEVADDAGLALMAKSRGARIELLSGRELIEVDWYPTLGSMLDGVMQRVIMGVGYYLGLYCLQCAVVILCLAAPVWLALYFSAYSPLGWLCLGAYALPSLILAAGMSKLKIPRRLLWALPLGYLVIGYGMLRALFTFLRRGGLYWRGGVYPLRELRASQRVRMGAFL